MVAIIVILGLAGEQNAYYIDCMKIDGEEIFRLRASGWKVAQLALRYGCSKSAASCYLNRRRTRINKQTKPMPCGCGCGQLGKWRRKYASQDCYYRVVRSAGTYMPWRQGQRRARKVVAGLFQLLPGHVVHHADKDDRNNDPANLWVFASHADHMSYHRGGMARPIWRGDGKAGCERLPCPKIDR